MYMYMYLSLLSGTHVHEHVIDAYIFTKVSWVVLGPTFAVQLKVLTKMGAGVFGFGGLEWWNGLEWIGCECAHTLYC